MKELSFISNANYPLSSNRLNDMQEYYTTIEKSLISMVLGLSNGIDKVIISGFENAGDGGVVVYGGELWVVKPAFSGTYIVFSKNPIKVTVGGVETVVGVERMATLSNSASGTSSVPVSEFKRLPKYLYEKSIGISSTKGFDFENENISIATSSFFISRDDLGTVRIGGYWFVKKDIWLLGWNKMMNLNDVNDPDATLMIPRFPLGGFKDLLIPIFTQNGVQSVIKFQSNGDVYILYNQGSQTFNNERIYINHCYYNPN